MLPPQAALLLWMCTCHEHEDLHNACCVTAWPGACCFSNAVCL
jgi:hypothetical protein